MDGKTHFIAGGLAGIAVSNYVGADVSTTIIFAALGSGIGLVPDLDVNGILANKLTFDKKWSHFLLGFIGIILMVYSFFIVEGHSQWIGIGMGLALLLIPSIVVKQRTMLLLTGIAVLLTGASLNKTWLLLFGIYIIIASRLPHRSLTHSLIGLAYFGVVGYFLEQDFRIDGMMLVCIVSYASHLILDMKWLPMNRKGVKLFQPFSNHEM